MAQKPKRKPARSTAKTKAVDHSTRNRGFAAAAAVGALAAGIGAAFRFGWLDALFPNKGASDGEHAAPDLAADAPTPGTDRAPDAFRPDPTAPVPDSEREALRPATGPSPSIVADRGSMNSQTAPAN